MISRSLLPLPSAVRRRTQLIVPRVRGVGSAEASPLSPGISSAGMCHGRHTPYDRRPIRGNGLTHHRDCGVQGGLGDGCDHTPAETVIGPFETEITRRRGPRQPPETVECATLEGVERFDIRRFLDPIGNIPPVAAEGRYHAQVGEPASAA